MVKVALQIAVLVLIANFVSAKFVTPALNKAMGPA